MTTVGWLPITDVVACTGEATGIGAATVAGCSTACRESILVRTKIVNGIVNATMPRAK
jgi:hypothetical protein